MSECGQSYSWRWPDNWLSQHQGLFSIYNRARSQPMRKDITCNITHWPSTMPYIKRNRPAINKYIFEWKHWYWGQYVLIAQCKTVVTPLLTQWSYHSLTLSHQYADLLHPPLTSSSACFSLSKRSAFVFSISDDNDWRLLSSSSWAVARRDSKSWRQSTYQTCEIT